MSDEIKAIGFTYGGWSVRVSPDSGEYILSDHIDYGVVDVEVPYARLKALRVLLQHIANNLKPSPEDEEDEDD